MEFQTVWHQIWHTNNKLLRRNMTEQSYGKDTCHVTYQSWGQWHTKTWCTNGFLKPCLSNVSYAFVVGLVARSECWSIQSSAHALVDAKNCTSQYGKELQHIHARRAAVKENRIRQKPCVKQAVRDTAANAHGQAKHPLKMMSQKISSRQTDMFHLKRQNKRAGDGQFSAERATTECAKQLETITAGHEKHACPHFGGTGKVGCADR